VTALFSNGLHVISIGLVQIISFSIFWLVLYVCSSRFCCDGLCVKAMAFGGEAASGGQLELPAVHGACQNAIFYVSEAREVSFQVGATALNAITMALPQLLCWR